MYLSSRQGSWDSVALTHFGFSSFATAVTTLVIRVRSVEGLTGGPTWVTEPQLEAVASHLSLYNILKDLDLGLLDFLWECWVHFRVFFCCCSFLYLQCFCLVNVPFRAYLFHFFFVNLV